MDLIADDLAAGTTLAEAEFNVEMLSGEMQRHGLTHEQVVWGMQHVSRGMKRVAMTPMTPSATELRIARGEERSLSPATLHKMITMTQQAAVLAYHDRVRIGYTQASWARWEGIRRRLHAWRGQVPRWADCSSFAAWCGDQALWHFRFSDRINGTDFTDGYTGTILNHGIYVPITKQRPGDLIVFGYSWPGSHVVVYTGGGLCVSHGNSAGPSLLPVSWVGHILGVRRFIY